MVDEFCREGGFVELRRKEVARENAAGAVVRRKTYIKWFITVEMIYSIQ
jgi:hypothetical protein